MIIQRKLLFASCIAGSLLLFGCQDKSASETSSATISVAATKSAPTPADPALFIGEPLVKNIYTADPSAHVFNGKLYIYPSHDIETGVTSSGEGDRFDMKDFHILSLDAVGGEVTDNGEALNIKDIPWAS